MMLLLLPPVPSSSILKPVISIALVTMGSPYPPFYLLLLSANIIIIIFCFYYVSMCLCFVLSMDLGCISAFPWFGLMGSSEGGYLASVPSDFRHSLMLRVRKTILGCMFPPEGFSGWSVFGLKHRQLIS